MRRSWAVWAVALVLLAGCAPDPKPPANSPSGTSAPPKGESGTAGGADLPLCLDLRGTWDRQSRTCSVVTALPKNVTVTTTIGYPDGLAAEPVLGAGLRGYARQFLDERTSAEYIASSGTASTGVSVLTGGSGTKTLVASESWYYQQMPHPVEALTTWTFDLARGGRIQLADLFCPGTDPLVALPPLVRPYLQEAYAAKTGGSSGGMAPLEQFEPGPSGYLDVDYRAWAVDGEDLLLYLPASRGPAGMPPGYLTPRVPLAALHSILRGSCAA